jgi:hypothetical protein
MQIKDETADPVQTISVKPYFRRTFSPVFKVWSCMIKNESVTTYTSFFNGKGIIDHSITFLPVEITLCKVIMRQMVNKMIPFKRIDSNTWSNGTEFTIPYQWCCKSVVHEQYSIIIKQISASYNYDSHRMFSSNVQMKDCEPNLLYCLQSDQTLVWMNNSFELCEIAAGKTVSAEKRGNEIISHEGNFAVTLKNTKKNICSISISETHEGLLMRIVSFNENS